MESTNEECVRPLLSVILPTRDRPELEVRAVRNALAQIVESIEVVVVIDGPSETTLRMLRPIEDARLRVRTLPTHLGESDARNAGVAEALGHWVVFLDDDDEWLPRKLEIQWQTTQQLYHLCSIVS